MRYKYLAPFLIVSLILFINITLQSTASADATPTYTFKYKQNKEGRLSYAKKLSSFFKKIDEFIPSLSPSQREWLDKELKEYEKTKNRSRYAEISNTKEYMIDDIKGYIDRVTSLLDSIQKSTELKTEIYLWSLIAEFLLKINFWSTLQTSIEKYEIVDKKLFYADSSTKIEQFGFYVTNGVFPATLIIGTIIQPYLKGEMIR